MVAGYDRYFQIVKCFRDEDLRADRQPEFTQIDCEMSFVTREDVIETFTAVMRLLFREVRGVELGDIQQMSYDRAMRYYGSDKPDLRFGMPIHYLDRVVAGADFAPFKDAIAEKGSVGALLVQAGANLTRKQLDTYTDFVKAPHRGLKSLVWARWNLDGSVKSSVDKFFTEEQVRGWFKDAGGVEGDLLLIGAGPANKVQKAMGDLRLELGEELGLRDKNKFVALWVMDFPMFEYDEDKGKWSFMHHPFTSPHKEDMEYLTSDPGRVRAYAYDFVVNGWEVGGGSIRIHDRKHQMQVFEALGLSPEEAQDKFGFLLDALKFGAPPHGGIAFGFDRLCALMAGADSIRDVMAFPKNNAGRDLMLDAPSPVGEEQLKELGVKLN
jgi:aspartyl-tRNA synthetase